MKKFKDVLNDLPKDFEEFWSKVVELMELSELTTEQLEPLKDEVLRLYTDSLLDTVSRSLDQDDLDFVTGYSALHPNVSELDVYFAVASEKPNVDKMMKSVMAEVFERLTYLKSKFSGVE